MGFCRYRRIEKDTRREKDTARGGEQKGSDEEMHKVEKRQTGSEKGRKRDASSCFEGAWAFSQRVRSVRVEGRGPLVGDKRETCEG